MNQEEWKEREKVYACWLCNFPNIGNAQLHRLSESLGGPEGVYYAGREQWGRILNPKQIEALSEYTLKWPPEAKYREMQQEGIELLTIQDKEYPERLRNIPDAPYCLFVRGRLPAEDIPAVAVIGARECSEYGRYVARELGTALGRHGVVVVSGMAKGIDGISQEAALEGGGMSLGVLGSGVDICYPAQNRDLYRLLTQKGAVISTYPLGTPARPQNFPPRNRIVSGLADVVVVIEARVKSGTLITVDMALEQGREVYVVPGRLTDRLSDGCNRLIKQGAEVCLSPEIFYEEIMQLKENKKENKIMQRSRKQWREEIPCTERVETPEAEPAKKLPEDLLTVYQAIDFYPKTAEEIGQALPEQYRGQMIPYLMQLCMEELILQVSPGHFCRRGDSPTIFGI